MSIVEKDDTSVDAESIRPTRTGSKRQKGPRPMADSIVDVKLVHFSPAAIYFPCELDMLTVWKTELWKTWSNSLIHPSGQAPLAADLIISLVT